MSGIPPNIPPQILAQLVQMMQQQGQQVPPGMQGQGPTFGMPQGGQNMSQFMNRGQPGGGTFTPGPAPGGGVGPGADPAHAAYHQLRMQNPNMPGWGQLSPQQQAQYAPGGGAGGGPNMGFAMGAGSPLSVLQNANYGPGGPPPGVAQAIQQAQALQPTWGNQATMPGGGQTMSGFMGRQAPAGPAPQSNLTTPPPQAPIKSFKKGGTVEKTGVYRLHKGERVIPAGKTAPPRQHASAKKTTVRHASGKAPPPKSTPVKHASARHAPPAKKRR